MSFWSPLLHNSKCLCWEFLAMGLFSLDFYRDCVFSEFRILGDAHEAITLNKLCFNWWCFLLFSLFLFFLQSQKLKTNKPTPYYILRKNKIRRATPCWLVNAPGSALLAPGFLCSFTTGTLFLRNRSRWQYGLTFLGDVVKDVNVCSLPLWRWIHHPQILSSKVFILLICGVKI